ncbi:hypothetical protein GJ632_17485, partial [Halogeometricum sp. CBA1124]|nr:hypothetical protein [Halogeometricum sp. CBA1124]
MNAPDWITLDEGETVEWSGGPVVASALPQLLAAGVVLVAPSPSPSSPASRGSSPSRAHSSPPSSP